jgi:hypothetical protein
MMKGMSPSDTADDVVEAKCANCGRDFSASIKRLEHSGLAVSIKIYGKLFLQVTDFCSKKCERDYIRKVESYGVPIEKVQCLETSIPDDLRAKLPRVDLHKRPTFYPLLFMLENMKENEKSYLLTGKCALCGTENAFQISHIIPKCIIRWLKKTSATGHIINAYDGKRIQDGAKEILLCPTCEKRFSVVEKYFYENFFIPHQKGVQSFRYDARLLKFIISVTWRTLQTQRRSSLTQKTSKEIVNALRSWKRFLLDESTNPELFEHHLLFLENVERLYRSYPDLLWYTRRSVHSGVIEQGERCLVFVKFPGILIVSCVKPPSNSRLTGTQISEAGILNVKQRILDDSLLELIIRQSEIQERIESDARKNDQIERDLAKNPEYSASESYSVVHEVEERWRRIVPNLAQDLISKLQLRIEREMLELNSRRPLQERMTRIYDATNNLTSGDIKRFGSAIATLIEKTQKKEQLVSCTITLGSLVILCCVSPEKKVEAAKALYEKSVERLLKENHAVHGNRLCLGIYLSLGSLHATEDLYILWML